jgi:hypothetical protein
LASGVFHGPQFPQCIAVPDSLVGARSHTRATMRIVNFALRSLADGFDKRGLIMKRYVERNGAIALVALAVLFVVVVLFH